MPPKRGKKLAAPSKEAPPQPLTVGEELDSTKPVLYIEHCRSCHVFRRRAVELHATLQERGLHELQLQLNALDRPPRRGAFELSLALRPTTDDTKQQPLWTGLKRTPRAQKWPDMDSLYEQIVQALAKPETVKEENQTEAQPKTTKKRKADSSEKSDVGQTVKSSSSAKRSKKSSPTGKK